MLARPAWRPGRLAVLISAMSVLAWLPVAPQTAASEGTATGSEIVELVHECVRARTGVDTCPVDKDAFSLRAYLDLAAICERIGGPSWAQGSAAERARFMDLIAEILEQEVRDRFGDRSVLIRNERVLPGSDILVAGEFVAKDDRMTRLSWLLRRKSGRLLMEDISIDGVSMVVSSRDQVQSLLGDTDGSLHSLAALLRKRYIRNATR